MKQFIMGVDLGQAADYTAVSIIEDRSIARNVPDIMDIAAGSPGPRRVERWYALRYLYRPPLGTSYPDIVAYLKKMVSTPEMTGNIEVVVDSTGVGRPVVDMIRAEGIYPVAVTITAGTNVHADGHDYSVPKIDIVGALQAAFGTRKLRMAPGLDLAPSLLKELERFSVKVTKAGNASYEALKESDHDDLVISLGLAVWWGQFSRGPSVTIDPLDKPEEPYNPADYVLT